MTLRVAMLIHDYHPCVGGAQTLLRAQAPRLKANGIEVHILTRHVAGTAAFEELDGVSVHRLPSLGSKALASLSFTLSALDCLRRLRPAVIHANEFISPATVALLANHLWSTPIVVTPHRSGALGDVQRLQNRFSGSLRMKALRNQVDAFVVISEEIGDELRAADMPPHHLHAIRNGVDTHRFCPLPPTEKAALRRRLNLSVDGVIAIFTGRLVHEKRLHHLLSVWSAVRAACPNAALLLIGEGAEEAALRNLSSEGVHFLGSRSDVTPYLQSADVFVLPSAAEGLSISMLEAMSTGLAPVVTRVGGAEEVITNEINGLLIPPDNLPKLQAALIRLLSDEPLRHAIGRAARERIEQAFSVEMSVERLFQLYSMLAAAR